MGVLDVLLRTEIPEPQTKQYKIKRLSKEAGEDVIFTLKELPFSRVADIKQKHGLDEEMEVHVVLAGVAEPDLRSEELQKKYGTATPAELCKRLLLPGEIADLSRAIEKLSGYRVNNLEEVKKK